MRPVALRPHVIELVAVDHRDMAARAPDLQVRTAPDQVPNHVQFIAPSENEKRTQSNISSSDVACDMSFIVDDIRFVSYKGHMFRTLPTLRFTAWLDGLKDKRTAAKVFARIVRVEAGNFGDAKSVGDKVSELRIAYGPGYRVYFTIKDGDLVILLVGGDKGSQDRDIKLAKEMAAEIHAEP